MPHGGMRTLQDCGQRGAGRAAAMPPESECESRLSDVRAECTTAIADYAVIGDCRSAALVSRDGSLDWLCLPNFASPAIFGALLNQPPRHEVAGSPPDKAGGGRFRIRPVVSAVATRRYLPESNVLDHVPRERRNGTRSRPDVASG